MTTASDLLRDAAEELRAAGVDTPQLDCQIMLSHATGLARTQLIAHPDFEPSPDILDLFWEMVKRRSAREPVAYIVGEREFYGLCFGVSPAVLIPRPDTETLVEACIDLLKENPSPRIADIGVGSGAISISLAHKIPGALVYATDASSEAVAIAAENAGRLGVEGRVQILEGDMFEPLEGIRFDLIVSNPPYIPTTEISFLEPEVSRFEPRLALDGGLDGLDCYRRLCAESTEFLVPGGFLAMEVGQGQSSAVMELMIQNGLGGVKTIRDYSGIERVVVGREGGD